MNSIKKAESVLKLKKLYFNSITFENNGIENTNASDDSTNIKFASNLIGGDNDTFQVVLKIKVQKKDEYTLDFSLTGIFEIEGGLNEPNMFFKRNAIAIMFPYMRSQLTLLTTQPGMSPIMIPPVNINNLLETVITTELE